MSKFTVGEIVKTESGREVEILKVDAPGLFPIIGMLVHDGSCDQWTERGWYEPKCWGSGYDLIPGSSDPVPKETADYSMIGKRFKNLSHWGENGYREVVEIIGTDPTRKGFFVQCIKNGAIDFVDENGETEWFECGGVWLKINLKEPI